VKGEEFNMGTPAPTTSSGNELSLDSSNETVNQRDESTNRKRIVQTIIDTAVIVFIFLIFGIVWGLVEPKKRYFTCDQSDIFFPFLPDTIPFWAVGVYGTLGPILVIIFVESLNAQLLPFQQNKRNRTKTERRRKFLICLFHGMSLFILGCAITLLLTEIAKKWVGRLRPHFMSVCDPDLQSMNCIGSASPGSYYIAIATDGVFCKGLNTKVNEARVSFPSGHSSYSWYTMVFLIIYVEARLFLLQLRYIKPLIQMTAFIAAFVTCLSRISDYHHRGSDVAGGTALGLKCYFSKYFIDSFIIKRIIFEK
jgi:phosphatidate phosphatase